MVASMACRDTEVAAVPDVAEGALVGTPPDWRRLYEQTLERAEAAEARAEELKWAEVVARSAAESLKWQFKEARRQRLAAVEDANGARRAAKNALFLEAEVARLTRLLGEAGVDPQPRGTEISLRREVARLRTVVAAQVQAHAELRKALRRSRRQKAALNALTKENAGLRRTAKASQGRVGTLEAELSKLRATAAVLSGTLYGRRSEKQETPRCGRRRGQRSGAPGHGRTPRPGIEERLEVHAPPAEARVCAACGKAYAANGADESSLLEIEVRAHRRVIRRGRWRRSCGCASSPAERTAPPVPRLFPSTPYGTSVWSRFLFEHYNGSEYINHRVADLLNKLHVEFTKSRPRGSNDNALVEGKNGHVVRKQFGHDHIPQRHAALVDDFAQQQLSPFLNYHRPCLFPVEHRDPTGKIRRRYPRQGVTTPYEAFKSLDDAHTHLKPGLTFAQLDTVAYAESDLTAAKRLNDHRRELFGTVFGDPLAA